MLRSIFRIFARIFPSLGHLLRESYFTLNGWRFGDLKQHIDLNRNVGSSLALSHSFSLALQPSSGSQPRIAFVSCLLPLETGISTCSLYSWLDYEGPLDIFAPATDMDWYFAQERMLRGNGKGPRLFDVGAFMTFDQVVNYDKIIIAIGNSNHHGYIFDLLRKLTSFGGMQRVVLYVHDPCLLNIVSLGTESSPKELLELLHAIYGRQIDAEHTDQHLHLKLVQQNVLGVRYFYNIGISRFLVNSEAARTMLTRDLDGLSVTIDKIFHPVFLTKGADTLDDYTKKDDALVIGTYGVTDFGKRIDDIADAVRFIRDKGINVRLLIAGFHVRNFFESNPNILNGLNFELFESPTDRQLVACMKQCDVAIQLRKYALGESSGIIPQLLLQGKTVLVSDLGAFAEYDNVTIKVASDEKPEQIAEKILQSVDMPIDPKILARYCQDRSPKSFQKRFADILELGLDKGR